MTSVNAFNASEGPQLRFSETIREWRKFEYRHTIPATMEKLRFELNLLKPGTFWLDDVRIDKVKNVE